MTTALEPVDIDRATVEKVLIHGDLTNLTPAQLVGYVRYVCERVGLDPLTQPFAYLVLNGKKVLYAKREATDQLRRVHNVSIEIPHRETVHDVHIVKARATLPSGRVDESIGAVSLAGGKGELLANVMMKADTKAKRRVTLAICGLGMLDESEVETLPPSVAAPVNDTPPAPRGPGDAPIPPPVVAPEPSVGAVQIVKVDKKQIKPNVTKFSITLSSGEVVTTISEWLASMAEQMLQQQRPVRVKTRSTKWGTDVLAIKPADEPDLPLEGPPAEDAPIPF